MSIKKECLFYDAQKCEYDCPHRGPHDYHETCDLQCAVVDCQVCSDVREKIKKEKEDE